MLERLGPQLWVAAVQPGIPEAALAAVAAHSRPPCRIDRGPGHPPPELRFSFRHHAEGRAKLQTIIDSRPDHVVVAHGEITRSGGAAYLRRAFDWLP